MTIFEYIKKYSNYTFQEKKINEVDKLIFSFLSYINLQNIELTNKNTLIEIYEKIEKEKKSPKKNIIAERDALKILKELVKTKRYQNCLVYDYVYEADNEYQFSAITIEYLPKHIYVSFEGTDEKISSWYEDFLLSYQPATKSHIKAIKYLKKYTFTRNSLIIGGHSKGGNIALVAAMNSNFILRNKIDEIYSMDGPGILPNEINSKRYKKIEKKYHHLIPENSLIGVILESTKNIVIKTTTSGILAHDIIYWDITDNYVTRSKLTYFSKTIKNDLNKFIYSLNQNQLENIINDFSEVCKNAEITSIVDIDKKSEKLIKVIKEISNTNSESKKLLLELIKIIIKSVRKSISLNILNKIERLKERIGK